MPYPGIKFWNLLPAVKSVVLGRVLFQLYCLTDTFMPRCTTLLEMLGKLWS